MYKERNVLLTESARARRNGMRLKYPQRKAAVRKSMARIKQVLAERRKIYREQPVPELPEDEDAGEGTGGLASLFGRGSS